MAFVSCQAGFTPPWSQYATGSTTSKQPTSHFRTGLHSTHALKEWKPQLAG